MGSTPSGTTDRRSLDRLFDALAHHHRRRILLEVADRDQALPTASVVERVGDGVGDGDDPQVTLYHRHLPKLAAVGYVEWNRDSGTLRRGGNFDEVAPVLQMFTDNGETLPGSWP